MSENKSEIEIRPFQLSDLENLKRFFILAYGKKTIFQNEQFLSHLFDASLNNKPSFSNCLVAVNDNNEIVAHYGGLEYNLNINGKVKSLIWGVNAYTLPSYRGKGISSKLIELIINGYEINGVIGFTDETALFYQKTGYNIFNFEKFTRHILVLQHQNTLEVSRYIKQNDSLLSDNNQSLTDILNRKYLNEAIELTPENINEYTFNLHQDFPHLTTTHRTKDFLQWRFLKNPFIKYSVLGVVVDGAVVAYAALREETLNPLSHKITRIIDLFGSIDAIPTLLQKTVSASVSKAHIYIDFSKFGLLYGNELNAFNFISLKNEDYCILPQVTSPIENRPNREFLGIFSKLSEDIKTLSPNNVYFTRMDSDRDRVASIDQITTTTPQKP